MPPKQNNVVAIHCGPSLPERLLCHHLGGQAEPLLLHQGEKRERFLLFHREAAASAKQMMKKKKKKEKEEDVTSFLV